MRRTQMRIRRDIYGKVYVDSELTIERLERCLKVSAKVVSIHGDKYLPLFVRINRELEEMRNKKMMMDLANKIANDN